MRLLVLYHAGFTHTRAVFDYLDAFRRHSHHDVEYFNVDQPHGLDLDFSGWNAVLMNFCAVSLVRVRPAPDYVGPIVRALRDFAGMRLVAVQDEYDFTNALKEFIARAGFQIVLTCVPPAAIDKIYPEFRHLHLESVLTGYLAGDVLSGPPPPLSERDIAIGYRGRELPWRLGDLGWHKSEIGRRFKAACVLRGIGCDIETGEASRFHGDDWLRFVRHCRVMLGSPSGANVFDFDGSLHRRIAARYAADKRLRYADIRDLIERHKVDFDMGQVSPRVFEAVVSKTALAMLRGNYSGVLEPDRHYLPVEPDYSNIDDIIDRVLDIDAMQEMAEQAFDHVVGNPGNHYKSLVARIDHLVDEAAHPAPLAPRQPELCVTRHPWGNDPYLIEKLIGLRRELERQADATRDFMRAAADGRLEVFQHPDGTLRLCKFEGSDHAGAKTARG